MIVGTTILLLLAIFLALQTSVSDRIFETAIEENASSIAELVWIVENSPAPTEAFILSAYESGSREARIDPSFTDYMTEDGELYRLLINSQSDVAQGLEGRDVRFHVLRALDLDSGQWGSDDFPLNAASVQQIGIQLADGRVLNIWLAPNISLSQQPNRLVLALSMIVFLAVALSLALYLVIKRPIRRLELDAERVGLAETALPVPETGPRELRRLSQALNRMRLRLASLIREREQIIVAIAHDIRTGLTRLTLRMDASPAVDLEEYRADLKQMEHLISDMLAYAKAEGPMIEHELVDLADLAYELAEHSPHDLTVVKDGKIGSFQIAGNRIALNRIFENLLENSRRYGGGKSWIRIKQDQDGLELAVEDDGEGIPDSELETVFEPFHRRETSRNRSTGGSGLGLGIARALAHSHGARITLHNLDEGGLSARVFFPAALSL